SVRSEEGVSSVPQRELAARMIEANLPFSGSFNQAHGLPSRMPVTLVEDFPRSPAHDHRAETMGLDRSQVTLAASELTDDQIHWFVAGGLPYEGFAMYVHWALGPSGPRGACPRQHGRGAIAARINARLGISLSAIELSDLSARHAATVIPRSAW